MTKEGGGEEKRGFNQIREEEKGEKGRRPQGRTHQSQDIFLRKKLKYDVGN